MVKIKGFTLIELMIVIAIVGILISVALGPIKDHARPNLNDAYSSHTEPADDINTVTINGVRHSCNATGDCEPID